MLVALAALRLAGVLLAGDYVQGQAIAPAPPPTQGDTGFVSIERVREALQHPVVLRLPPRANGQPHFRAEVTETDWRLPTIFEAIRLELASSPGSRASLPNVVAQPAISVDLLQLVLALKDKIGAVRRGRAERDARRLVQEELTAFCAIHDCSVVEGDEH